MKIIRKDCCHGCPHPIPNTPQLKGTAHFESHEQGIVLPVEPMTITEVICHMVEPRTKGKLKQQKELEHARPWISQVRYLQRTVSLPDKWSFLPCVVLHK